MNWRFTWYPFCTLLGIALMLAGAPVAGAITVALSFRLWPEKDKVA